LTTIVIYPVPSPPVPVHVSPDPLWLASPVQTKALNWVFTAAAT